MSRMPTDAEIDEMSEAEHEAYLGSAPERELDGAIREGRGRVAADG